MAQSLYDQVLNTCLPYFESRTHAELFLVRQCQFHLNCEPKNLMPSHLWSLANWAMVSGGLLIGKDKAVEMCDKIRAIRRDMSMATARP